MQVYFNSRTAQRSAKFGKAIDNGTDSPKGKRWGREVIAKSNVLPKLQLVQGRNGKTVIVTTK